MPCGISLSNLSKIFSRIISEIINRSLLSETISSSKTFSPSGICSIKNVFKFFTFLPFLADTGNTSRSSPESENFAISSGMFSLGIMSIFVYAIAMGIPSDLYFFISDKSSSEMPSCPSTTYKRKSTDFALVSVVRIIMSVSAFLAL